MGMANDLITEGQIYLPCRLGLTLLQVICNEINQMHGIISNTHQFARVLPRLTKYLNAYPVVGLNNTGQWMEKLEAISKDLKTAEEFGEKYPGKFDEFIKGYLMGKEYEALVQRDAMQPEVDELERHQEERQISRGQMPKTEELLQKLDPDAIADMEIVQDQLKQFLDLYKRYQNAQGIVAQYQEITNLMVRVISLPPAESDLLMLYQATLERRLSSAIGGLLVLQRSTKP